jgi:hypothetical protein
MKNYKQWTGSHRLKMYRKLKAKEKKDDLPAWFKMKGSCSMCGCNYNTMPHAEEYGPTFDDYLKNIYILCARCHGMLHLRFRFVGQWVEYLQYIRDVKKGITKRLPPIKHIKVIFDQSKKWKPIKIKYVPNDNGEWWEKLSIVRIENGKT